MWSINTDFDPDYILLCIPRNVLNVKHF
jgi:hypothetical protein